METTLADLAGATLDDVTVDWRNAIVRITFLATQAGDSCAIRAIDFTRVEIARGGTSRRVKSATQVGNALEIVMESGETLRVESASFAVDLLGG